MAAAKSAVGRSNPGFVSAHNRANAAFLYEMHSYILSMVVRAGQPKGWPGSLTTGIVTPVRLITHGRSNSGGEVYNLSSEAVTMATIPTLDPFNEMTREMSLVTTALRSLRKVKLNNPQSDASRVQVLVVLQDERKRLVAQILPYVHRSLENIGEMS